MILDFSRYVFIPDYEFGFGLIDAKAAIDLIRTLKSDDQYIISDVIADKESKSYCIDNSTDTDLKTTIAWIDPADHPINQDKTLVNDIDISIAEDNNYTAYPFSLDKQNPTLPATADKPNKVDNIEQIVLATKQRGIILHVTGAHIVENKQQFALASNKQFVKLPLPPTNIKAKSINNHTIQLSWENNNTDIDNELQIFRNNKLINTIKADKKKFLDNKLQPNTIYRYKIAIADLCSRKIYSKEISIKTPNKIKRPSNLQIKPLGVEKILLQWEDNSCNEKGLYI